MGWFALLAAATAIVSVVASIYSVLDLALLAALLLCAMLRPLVAGVVLLRRPTEGVAAALAVPQSGEIEQTA